MIFPSLFGSLWFLGQWFLSKRKLSDGRRGVLWGVIALEVLLAAGRCAARSCIGRPAVPHHDAVRGTTVESWPACRYLCRWAVGRILSLPETSGSSEARSSSRFCSSVSRGLVGLAAVLRPVVAALVLLLGLPALRLWGRVLPALAGLGRMKANPEVLPVARVRASGQGRTTWSSKSIWEPILRWSAAFLSQNVFYERIRSFTCVLVWEMLQSCTKWEQSIISQEV